MDGYDQALLLLGAILVVGMIGLLALVAQARKLDASIQKHEAMLAEQQARKAVGLHPAE